MNIRRVSGLVLCAAVLSCAPAFAQTKVAIINMEEAIARTQEGQRLMQEFQAKYAPRQQELQSIQAEIQDLESQLANGANTMSKRNRRTRCIDDSFRAGRRGGIERGRELRSAADIN